MSSHIGTSGWSYDHWQGVLYPPGTSVAKRLGYYLAQFDTVELNSSFYRWPKPSAFAGWREKLPATFRLCVKAPRWLTHYGNLTNPERWLDRINEGWHELGDKRAILLVQLSPNFAYNHERLAHFLSLLPDWMPTAVEFRHPSWHQEAVYTLLEQHQVAYCVMSGAGLPCILRATAPFVYVRLHGPEGHTLYGGSYSDDDLRWWADRIREWTEQQRDVYVYFNNDIGGHAVRNALRLRELVSE
ncbi:protein of unknown function DUF72 [Fibrella aestuarina BUZ 2]|uniref:Sensor histidine kinase n=1 Tax=Fibrella aestuarina BUZ 2 TaxID=1166018 RepID=I0K7Q8_9BACT|nr:DUF72 domain-containing protein [Fibrella aestuarina]CCH00161.1 protein of unknown function DUF72 [Fibrella aestuarina BUZ 2]